MKAIEIIRYLSGYIIGATLFALLIPFGIYKLSVFSNHFIQMGFLENIFIRLPAVLLLCIGIVFAIWSNIYLFEVGKGGPTDAFGVAVSPRTRHLVVEGPYRYSRNPMVFGALSCYFAMAVLFKSVICIGAVLLFFCLIILMLKFSEEKRLLHDLGEQYIQYKQKVSMIIPWPKR